MPDPRLLCVGRLGEMITGAILLPQGAGLARGLPLTPELPVRHAVERAAQRVSLAPAKIVHDLLIRRTYPGPPIKSADVARSVRERRAGQSRRDRYRLFHLPIKGTPRARQEDGDLIALRAGEHTAKVGKDRLRVIRAICSPAVQISSRAR